MDRNTNARENEMKGFSLLETESRMLHRKLMVHEVAELGVVDLTVERLEQLLDIVGIAECFYGTDGELDLRCAEASGEVFIIYDRKRERFLLVDPQGASYPRYMAYLPRALGATQYGSTGRGIELPS